MLLASRLIRASRVLGHSHPRALASTAYATAHAPAERRATPPTPANAPAVPEHLSQHLDKTFAPLKFPPTVAQRILTHLSHRDSVTGHNSRFAFLGRRTLEAYLLLFLQALPAAARHDHARIVAHVLNTHTLGQHVAPRWKLQEVMRWVPPRAGDGVLDGRVAGVYKVAGTTVEAVVGGVLHQFGGSVAHRLFHTRLLPHILLPGSPLGLPDVLHADALSAAERYGGPEGPLVRG
ncbi:ribonuclease-III-like-domain-containing protein [Lactarius hatsudake]|nr:ribonuclease-III-like-domain-containing protein [Lactarius hatsudake]